MLRLTPHHQKQLVGGEGRKRKGKICHEGPSLHTFPKHPLGQTLGPALYTHKPMYEEDANGIQCVQIRTWQLRQEPRSHPQPRSGFQLGFT